MVKNNYSKDFGTGLLPLKPLPRYKGKPLYLVSFLPISVIFICVWLEWILWLLFINCLL